RAVDVAGAIAAPQLFARELFDALVVDLHLFDRLDIIVEDHLLRSDHRHRAELGWREPRKVRVRDRSRRESDHQEDDVLDLWLDEARTGGLYPRGLLAELAVGSDRSRDAHRVDRAIVEELVMGGRRAHRREALAYGLEPLLGEIRDRDRLGPGHLAQVADEVRSPVTRTDDSDAQR